MGFVPVQAEMEHAIHREFHFLASSNTNQYFSTLCLSFVRVIPRIIRRVPFKLS